VGRRRAPRARRVAPPQPAGQLAAPLQVARSEPEAYSTLARHLARSTSSEQVTILNRNNSADRLEPVTPVREGSPVADGLEGAKPDSCLAIRMAGTHRGRPGSDAVLTCDVCGKSAQRTTCVPSVVGGEVIGAVLVEHEQPFGGAPERQITASSASPSCRRTHLRPRRSCGPRTGRSTRPRPTAAIASSWPPFSPRSPGSARLGSSCQRVLSRSRWPLPSSVAA